MPSKILSSVFTMLRAGGQVLIIRLLALLLQFGFIWYITNYLGDNIYGEFVIFLMITHIIGTSANLGLGTYIVKHIGAHYPNTQQSYSRLLGTSLACTSIVSIGVTTLVVSLLHTLIPGYLPTLPLWTYLLGSLAYGFMVIFVEYFRAFRWITLSSVLSYLVAPSIALVILWLFKVPGDSLYPLVLAWLTAIGLIVAFAFTWRLIVQDRDSQSNTRESVASLLGYSLPFFLATMLVFCNEWIDKMILNAYVAPEVIGHYHVAFKFASFVSLPLMAFNTLLAPKIAASFESKDRSKLRKDIVYILTWSLGLALFVLVTYLLFGRWILDIFGESFSSMYTILIILSIGQLVNVIAGPVGVVMKMTNLQHIYVKVMLASVLINALLNLVLIPTLGALGAAIGSSIGLITVNLLSWYICKRNLNISVGL